MCSEAQRRGGLLCEDTTTLVVRSTRATPTAWVAIFALDAAAPATTTLSEPATAGVRATPATTSSTTPTGSRRGAGAWNTLTGTRTAPPRCANPGPVGLLGFGLSTILLNLHNTGSFPLSTVIVAMGICLGGGAQPLHCCMSPSLLSSPLSLFSVDTHMHTHACMIYIYIYIYMYVSLCVCVCLSFPLNDAVVFRPCCCASFPRFLFAVHRHRPARAHAIPPPPSHMQNQEQCNARRWSAGVVRRKAIVCATWIVGVCVCGSRGGK
ncbi:GPR1/FUN34/yaaH family [Leishmania donovani]|uniref:GPR1/FUN34/yaaH_family_putative/Pfam:PF01184 n=1 Tax=Leishmania donovani TaxID=5661 RepID=A0A6J8F5Z7_LEIDO|nr:GPR1/FUN34/yaaH family [Leishmania donovani]VDZ41684.1 GPR1/FUN34/yaaH_family_putative/Pfam:PF01184 [Leishmania donovani]